MSAEDFINKHGFLPPITKDIHGDFTIKALYKSICIIGSNQSLSKLLDLLSAGLVDANEGGN